MRNGQSIIEVLIASAVGVILITGAVVIIAPTLKGSSAATARFVSVGLATDLLEHVRVWSESDWNRIASLSTSTAAQYYLSTSTSPFTVQSGIESINFTTSTYIRYFSVSDVFRDPSGAIIVGSGVIDPSTKQVTVAYGKMGSGTSTLVTYVTRYAHRIVFQTDWSGGDTAPVSATTTSNTFATSSNVDVVSSTGSIYIDF